jgi:DegV family protein with EDD domain
MSGVGIITDTISSLPPEIIQQYGIKIVPIVLSINGERLRDQVDISVEEFWKRFDTIKEYTTSAPSLAEFIEAFTEFSRDHKEIVCCFVSKGLSATYESAVQARDEFARANPGIKIEILDSRTAAGAEGFIVLEMAKAAAAGKSLAEVIKAGEDTIPRVGFICALETLKYIIRSGRAPKTAYMGELFQVKPLVGIVHNTGVVENMGRARGKEKSYEKIVELMGDYIDINNPVAVNIHYTASVQDGEHLKQMVTSRYKCSEVFFTPYSPVISGHTGPVVCVSFYPMK